MRKALVTVLAGFVITSIAVTAPASANPSDSHRPIACIGNGHSCTHDMDCCSNNCVSRTCK